MRVVDGFRGLSQVAQRHCGRKRALDTAYPVDQRATRNVRRNKICHHLVLSHPLLAEVVNGQDMRVFQRGSSLGLTFKVSQVGAVRCEYGREALHRYLTTKLGILREPDLSHTSSPQQPEQPIPTEHFVLPPTVLIFAHVGNLRASRSKHCRLYHCILLPAIAHQPTMLEL